MQKMWWAILDSRTKVKWMLITILVPEIIVGKALGERLAATKRFLPEHLDWKVVHLYMANMGYFVLDLGELADPLAAEEWKSSQDPDSLGKVKLRNQGDAPDDITAVNITSDLKVSRRNIFDAAGKSISISSQINLSRLKWRYWALNFEQLVRIFDELGDIHEIHASQLEKLDRGGKLVKVLALVQVAYLILQLIGRKVGGLASAQIEIAALAFAACSIITYLLYWNRPQGVETIHVIKLKTDVSKVLTRLKILGSSGPEYLWLTPRTEPTFYPDLGPVPIPNDATHHIGGMHGDFFGENDEIMFLIIGAFIGGTIFGSLHCLAWHFHFPTPGEALGWRICSVATTCIPILSVAPIAAWMNLNPFSIEKRGSEALRILVGMIGIGLFLVPYVLARIFLLVEIFRTLFFLPQEAFVDTWSGSFPHIG
jgi:hypothetical protein